MATAKYFDPIYNQKQEDDLETTIDQILRDGVFYRDIRVFLNTWLDKRYGWTIQRSFELWHACNYADKQMKKCYSFAEAWNYIMSQPELPPEGNP